MHWDQRPYAVNVTGPPQNRVVDFPKGTSLRPDLVAARDRPLILCALAFEERRLRRSERLSAAAEIRRTGPGVERTLDALLAVEDDFGPIVLAGLAGALHPRCEPGRAWVARRILSDDGEQWAATWPDARPETAGLLMADILTSRVMIGSLEARRQARETTWADLVDMESAALAAWATQAGRPWGVVRGVSDPFDLALPPGIEHWISVNGSLRWGRVAADVALRPWNIPLVRRLGRHAEEAMREVVRVLEGIV